MTMLGYSVILGLIALLGCSGPVLKDPSLTAAVEWWQNPEDDQGDDPDLLEIMPESVIEAAPLPQVASPPSDPISAQSTADPADDLLEDSVDWDDVDPVGAEPIAPIGAAERPGGMGRLAGILFAAAAIVFYAAFRLIMESRRKGRP